MCLLEEALWPSRPCRNRWGSPLAYVVSGRHWNFGLKLIACDDGKIGTYARLVDDRNKTAHSNGNIFCITQAGMDAIIAETLRVVEEIQTYSRPVIEDAYRDFLLQSHDPDEREYPDAADQIREVLVRENYLSLEDIDICFDFDLAGIADRPEIESISSLHKVLRSTYGSQYEHANPPAGAH